MKYNSETNYKVLIHSAKWHRLRCQTLAAHPTCEVCGTLATEVHHRQPLDLFRNDPVMMEKMCFDPENLQCLCREHHLMVHKELGKFHSKKIDVAACNEERKNRFERTWLGK